LIFEVFQLKTRILQVWDDECSLKREKARPSEILQDWAVEGSLKRENLAQA